MKKTTVLMPGDNVTIVGRAFGTPLVVKGLTWFPVVELVVWAVMTWLAGKKSPRRTGWQRLGVGALTTLVILGSEWCHNLAHAAAAHWVKKPMDAIRIVGGMPLVVYHNIQDASVTPKQHIIRAMGGPLFNAFLLLIARGLRRFTRPASVARDVADAAVGVNTFLSTVSLLPVPGIDGGPILKWALVERGKTPHEANEAVKVVNQILGGGLAVATGVLLQKRKWFAGALSGMFALLALAVGFGLLKEQE